VHPDAVLHPGVELGPFSVIGPGVELGSDVRVGAHAVVERDTRIGAGCRIAQGAVLGSDPQDLKYAGESTRLEVGERTRVREFCTLNRGTAATGITRVGSDCLLMAYTHVAHDCVIGDHVILSNAVQLGGHVHVGDWAIVGALAGAHQFTRIGEHSFIGGATKIAQDVPPYVLADGNPCIARGINAVGLQRRGFSPEAVAGLRIAFRTLFRNRELNLGQALSLLETRDDLSSETRSLLSFIRESERGVIS
jgi:UDP-N-acetylglucosamine acyltransferase